jgi:hypothetical protein
MISELSASQWAQVARLRDEWVKVAASSEPADRHAAEAAISSIYRSAGRPAPRFAWFDSPATASFACTLQWQLQLPRPLWPLVGRPVAAAIWESAWFSRGLQASLAGTLSDSLSGPLRRALGRMILRAATGRWRAGPLMQVLGDSLAVLAHEQHGFAGIAPGEYVIRRQREYTGPDEYTLRQQRLVYD